MSVSPVTETPTPQAPPPNSEWSGPPGGSIASLLRQFGPFAEPLVCAYISQALLGLDYLHREGILHRSQEPAAGAASPAPLVPVTQSHRLGHPSVRGHQPRATVVHPHRNQNPTHLQSVPSPSDASMMDDRSFDSWVLVSSVPCM